MSRSKTSASRAERHVKSAASNRITLTEIIAGKYSENNWLSEDESGNELCYEIVKEIIDAALDVTFQNSIPWQVIIYTVWKAEEAISKIIKLNFLNIDPGECDIENDPSWIEDDEPQLLLIDRAAMGRLPNKSTTVTDKLKTLPPIDHVKTSDVIEHVSKDMLDEIIKSIPIEPDDDEQNKENTSASKDEGTTQPSAIRKTYHKSRVRRSEEKCIEEPQTVDSILNSSNSIPKYPSNVLMPNSCQAVLKLEKGRPPGKRDIEYDEWGQARFNKIQPEQLPTHQIETSIRLLDLHSDDVISSFDSKNMQKKRRISKQSTKIDSSKNAMQLKPLYKDSLNSYIIKPLLPPLLLDCTDLSPGVTIYEGDRNKRGSEYPLSEYRILQRLHDVNGTFIQKRRPSEEVNIKELLRDNVPIIRPISRMTKTF